MLNKFAIWGLVFIVGLFVALLSLGVLKPQAGIPSGNVWCDNFDFYCCQEVNVDSNPSISSTVFASCPFSSEKCQIVSASANSGYLYVGSLNCRVVSDFSTLWVSIYKCDDQVTVKNYASSVSNVDVSKGFKVWSDRSMSFAFRVVNTRLAYTGSSADAKAGIPVPGSSSCVWDQNLGKPSDRNFNSLSVSYTVPPNDCILGKSGTQFLCGNINDECSSDSDCVGYPINGNQVCTANTLMTYRCLPKGSLPSGVSVVSTGKYVGQPTIGGADSTKYSGTGKVCTVDLTLNKPVSCCPGSNVCGSNAFCDSKSFTCKASTQCTVDSDCTQAPSCDFVNLLSKTPYCNSGQCAFKSKPVSCCVDSNCAVTESCVNNVCVANPNKVDACPFACCVDDPAVSGYAKRSCPSGQVCSNNACTTVGGCTLDSECDPTKSCINGECVLKESKCSALLGGLVPSTLGVKSECGFFCSIGLSKPTPVNVCVYDWTLVIILGVVLIVALVLFATFRGKSKGRKPNTKMLKVLGIVAFIGALIYFLWVYIFWIIIGLIVLSLVDTFVLGGVIKKVILR